ncbi:MAG: hypothetical protein ACXV5D_05820 [Halobacteriota archaeon]
MKYPHCPRYDCATLLETFDNGAAQVNVDDPRERATLESSGHGKRSGTAASGSTKTTAMACGRFLLIMPRTADEPIKHGGSWHNMTVRNALMRARA